MFYCFYAEFGGYSHGEKVQSLLEVVLIFSTVVVLSIIFGLRKLEQSEELGILSREQTNEWKVKGYVFRTFYKLVIICHKNKKVPFHPPP